jgi:hypothetical protein
MQHVGGDPLDATRGTTEDRDIDVAELLDVFDDRQFFEDRGLHGFEMTHLLDDRGEFDEARRFHIGSVEDGLQSTFADMTITDDRNADLIHERLRMVNGWE